MAGQSADKTVAAVVSQSGGRAVAAVTSPFAAKAEVVVSSRAQTFPPTADTPDASNADACAGLPTHAHLQARSNAALANARIRIKVPLSPVPGATFAVLFRHRLFDVVTPELDAGDIFYCKLRDPAQVNIIPMSERSFSNSHFKRLYGTATCPEYQVREVSGYLALIARCVMCRVILP